MQQIHEIGIDPNEKGIVQMILFRDSGPEFRRHWKVADHRLDWIARDNCSISRITKITAINDGIACNNLKRMKRSMAASSGEPEEAGGIAVKPLLDDRVLQRQVPIFGDQFFEGCSEQIAR